MFAGNFCRCGKFCRPTLTKSHNKRLFVMALVVNFGSITQSLAIYLLNHQPVYQLAYLLLSDVLQRNIKRPWRTAMQHGMMYASLMPLGSC